MYPLCNVCAEVGALCPRNDWKVCVMIPVRQFLTTMLIESIKSLLLMARQRVGSQLWKSLGVLAQGYSIKAKPTKIHQS